MIENEEHKNDLIEIANKLKVKSQSCPTDEDGNPTETYLEYISLMYNPEVANIVKNLEIFPTSTSLFKLSKKLGMSKEEVSNLLEEPVRSSFIFKLGSRYSLANPLMIHDAPFILKANYDKENIKDFANLSRKYFEQEKYYKIWETSRRGNPRMRVLTVSEMVEPKDHIVPIEEVYNIIEQNEDFALIPCPCRLRKDIEGTRLCKDKYPIHNCVIMGPMAKGLNDLGDEGVEKVDKERVKELTREAAELGLVHATDNVAENVNILCACCECCCGTIGGLTRYDNPRAIARANYISSIDEDLCVACGTCIERCKFGAIVVEEVAFVNENRCLGCGLCAVTCPEEAITMIRYEREEIPDLKKLKKS
ncbi:MAG: 4Fe-4S binding protein [Promethearchaeota archaeon]